MNAAEWSLLAGVFLGGALPWLEAIVVIPVGILGGLSPVLVVVVAVFGNLLTVGLAAWFGERLRNWWLSRRRSKRPADAGNAEPSTIERRERRRARINRMMARWGMPGLAVLGPIGLGTQFSALAAVAAGIRPRVAFTWVGAGTVAWSIAAAALTSAGISVAGIGAI